MKKLKLFVKFDYQSFFKGKKLLLVSMMPKHNEYFNGVIAELVIIEDNTNYDGETGCNSYEKLSFKIPNVSDDFISSFKINQVVRITEVYKANVWRKKDSYEDLLSIEGKIAPVNNEH